MILGHAFEDVILADSSETVSNMIKSIIEDSTNEAISLICTVSSSATEKKKTCENMKKIAARLVCARLFSHDSHFEDEESNQHENIMLYDFLSKTPFNVNQVRLSAAAMKR